MITDERGLELRIPPLVVVGLTGVLMWLVGRATPQLALLYSGRIGLSVLLALLGVAVMVAGVLEFNKANTTVNPHLPTNSASVVTSGVYRFTRNPMYLGMLFVLLAWAAFLANAAAAILPLLFVIYVTRYQIRPEERVLAAKFGASYESYLRSVRRWL
jgi:protein-S-isoprenylcysteine O-methyltransferase Ste14